MPERKWDKSFSGDEVKILEEAAALALEMIASDGELRRADKARTIAVRQVMAVAAGGEWNPEVLAREAIADLRHREQVRRSALNAKERLDG